MFYRLEIEDCVWRAKYAVVSLVEKQRQMQALMEKLARAAGKNGFIS